MFVVWSLAYNLSDLSVPTRNMRVPVGIGCKIIEIRKTPSPTTRQCANHSGVKKERTLRVGVGWYIRTICRHPKSLAIAKSEIYQTLPIDKESKMLKDGCFAVLKRHKYINKFQRPRQNIAIRRIGYYTTTCQQYN